jgi:hypothetical protein
MKPSCLQLVVAHFLVYLTAGTRPAQKCQTGELQHSASFFHPLSSGFCLGLFAAALLSAASLSHAATCPWTINATDYRRQSDSALTLTGSGGVLPSNRRDRNSNCAVTNTVTGATQFYRLFKP